MGSMPKWSRHYPVKVDEGGFKSPWSRFEVKGKTMDKFGFYSKMMADHTGTVWYESPYTDSGEVEVTCVSDDPWDSGVKWDDINYVGVVTNFLRRGQPGQRRMQTNKQLFDIGALDIPPYAEKLDSTPVEEFDWDTYNNVPPWKLKNK